MGESVAKPVLGWARALRQRMNEPMAAFCSAWVRWSDNFSPHRHPDVRNWAADNDAELVFLPAYSSWLNWIEAEFAALRYFALNGTMTR
ncbi:transposase [Saccharothrix sp.]|uniref:transposase n=1 Tax=Saccharothrix sp. TaxID=1873460 RepID=UPI0028113386|nr:transposase [Saccharothrix sp.]